MFWLREVLLRFERVGAVSHRRSLRTIPIGLIRPRDAPWVTPNPPPPHQAYHSRRTRAVLNPSSRRPRTHTPSPTPNTRSHLPSDSLRAVFGVYVGLMVRPEADDVEVVLCVDLSSPTEAQRKGPQTQSERHNHTVPTREPARLAILRGYGAKRRAFRPLRRRAHRAPILLRARLSRPLDELTGSSSRSLTSPQIEPTSIVCSAGGPLKTMGPRGRATSAHGGAAGQRGHRWRPPRAAVQSSSGSSE